SWFEDLLTTEHQKLTGELRRPTRSAEDFIDTGSKRMVRFHLLLHDFAVTGDHPQQVVEIVSDASGKPPHRLHLLGLMKLPFELPSCGDIPVHDNNLLNLALRIQDGAGG